MYHVFHSLTSVKIDVREVRYMVQKNQVNVDGIVIEHTTPVYDPMVKKYNMVINYAEYPEQKLFYQDKTEELAIKNGVARFLLEYPIDMARCL